MQTAGTRLIFVMNCSVLHFFKFACRMPQIAQSLVSTLKICWGGGGGVMLPGPLDIPPLFFSLAIPGSDSENTIGL